MNLFKRITRLRWGRIVLGGAYTLVAAEWFLRIVAPIPLLPRYVDSTDYGIRGNLADRSYWHRTAEYRVLIETNDKGIRAPQPIPYEKGPGVQRIVVLGDSFGMGYGVNLEETFLTRMETGLEGAGRDVEIVNLSVSGHGNAEQLIALREEGLRYQPDLVLLAWHSTDLSDNVRSNLFALEGNALVARAPSYLPGVAVRKRLSQYAAYRYLAENSHLYNWAREFVPTKVKKILFLFHREPANSPGPVADVEAPALVYESEFGKPGELAVALLREIQAESRAAGAELLILDIPDRRARSRTEFFSRFPIGPGGDTHGLDVVSPLGPFREEFGKKLYWERSHGHLTPLGCRIVGDLLSGHILERGLL